MPTILLVVALDCEARPLINFFKLKKNQTCSAFSVYQNLEINITLVVSGVGLLQSAAATAYVAALLPNTHKLIFINLGIAGGFNCQVGDLFLADTLRCEKQGVFYPMALSYFNFKKKPLLTVLSPTDLPLCELVDMEAYGFYQAALRFSTSELVQVVKVVSDNQSERVNTIHADKVKGLIESNLDAIRQLIERLRKLALKTNNEDPTLLNWVAKLKQRFHFSYYQTQQMRGYLKKIMALNLESELMELFEKSFSSSDWLKQAKKTIYENHLY